MPELLFYADQSDRTFNRPTRRWFSSLGEANRAADALVPPAQVVDLRTDTGVSVPVAYRDLFERDPDPDGPVTHSWARDDWSKWVEAPLSAHGAQVFTPSVVGRRGRITASATTEGNHRTWFLRKGTRWPDSEIVSLWWPPSIFTAAGAPTLNRPQQGHVHGVYVGDDGRMRGAGVWANIFGTNPNPQALVANIAEGDGTTLFQGNGGSAGSTDAVDRAARVIWANRFSFGGGLIDMSLHPHWAADSIVTASTGDLAGMAATGLNGTALVVQGGQQHQGLVRVNVADTTPLTDPIAGGTWTPAYPWRVYPYWVRSRYVPPRIMIKQWAYGRVEPDWGGPHTWVFDLTIGLPGTATEVPNKPGLQGIWTAHAHTSSWMEFGDITFSRAPAA